MEKKLQRIPQQGAVAGVCAGLAAYFSIDKAWVRAAFIISVFFSGYMGVGLLGPIVYIVLWIVLPVKSFVLPQDPFDVDYRTGPGQPAADAGSGYRSTRDQAANPAVSAPKSSKDRYVAGMILVALGLFFLLHQLDVLHWRDVARYWPVLIIISGIATIAGAFKPRKSRPFPVPENEASDHTAETGPDAADGADNQTTYSK